MRNTSAAGRSTRSLGNVNDSGNVKNSRTERVLYLTVAILWAYSLTSATKPLEIHASRATALGHVARWTALFGVAIAGLTVYPLGGFHTLWMMGFIRDIYTGWEVLLFLCGLFALGLAFVALVKAVKSSRSSKGNASG